MQSRLNGLYALTDQQLTPPNKIETSVQQAIDGGCRIVQYRDKTSSPELRLKQAQALKTLCANNHVLLIINDDIQLAKTVDADGVHLGEDDATIRQAREQLGECIIGVSCYNDLRLAQQAQSDGADYIAFGSFFQSSVKPDARPASIQLLLDARQTLDLPIAAIGGITRNNAASLIEAGADMLAVITDVFAQEDINRAARDYSQLFKKHDA